MKIPRACALFVCPCLYALPSSAATPPEIRGYIQLRYTAPEAADDFGSIRRLKLFIDGKASNHLDYHAEGIFKSNNRSSSDGQPYLQELSSRWRGAHHSWTLGQMKVPFGLERYTSSRELGTIDRAIASESLVPNGKLRDGRSFARDRGVMWDGELSSRLHATFALFDGNGVNSSPHGIGPLTVTRLRWNVPTHAARRLVLGTALSTRRARDLDFSNALPGMGVLGYDHFTGRDSRVNVEGTLEWSNATLTGEYFRAHFSPSSPAQMSVDATGYYVQTTKAIAPRLQAVVKFEEFDATVRVHDPNDIRQTTLGVNLRLRGAQDRVQLNYVLRSERGPHVSNNALMLQVLKIF